MGLPLLRLNKVVKRMLGTTPMFIQYNKIKKDYPNILLFYRLGDFYEMFGDDAIKASKLLDLALTAREGGQGVKIPMCGVPYHSANNYISRLIATGEKVAICEQIEDPKTTKGLVRREVIRVISKGTLLDEGGLKKSSNYIISVSKYYKKFGLAISDVSTGEFFTTEINCFDELKNEISIYNPSECIYSEDTGNIIGMLKQIVIGEDIAFTLYDSHAFDLDHALKILKTHFCVQSLEGFGYENQKASLIASGALMDYLMDSYKKPPSHITKMKFYSIEKTMLLDYATKTNLELVKSLSTQDKKDSLFDILDRCKTAFGSRLLKNYIEKPLIDKIEIEERLDATEILALTHYIRIDLENELNNISDLERIVSKIAYHSANPKDLVALKNSLCYLPRIKSLISELDTKIFKEMYNDFDTLEDIHSSIDKIIVDDPPFSSREGGIIRSSYDYLIQENRDLVNHSEMYLNKLIEKEKEKTGIKSLKLGFNRVFGYYLEVSKSYIKNVPSNYVRKQTLANTERFITDELKEMETKILNANEILRTYEYKLFIEFIEQLKNHLPRILQTTKKLAQIDVLQSFAAVALDNLWIKPHIVSNSNEYLIKNLRHPIVEKKITSKYVPNHVRFNEDGYFLIITGPNMAGKSTYCRSVACASILAQIGSFIPADTANMTIVDRVFARIGASDKLSLGQSTFMVEMSEVANIVHNATENSLVILDEVGRGTSTFDGLSIAWALSEYLSQKIKCKCLFATHYHELTHLEELFGVQNYSILVDETEKGILFLHKITHKPANKSYGIHVAKLAGIPQLILARAETILCTLENNDSIKNKSMTQHFFEDNISQLSMIENKYNKLVEYIMKIKRLSIEDLSLRELSNHLIELHDEAIEIMEEGTYE
jgi:DNA mismatch repair protein mutS